MLSKATTSINMRTTRALRKKSLLFPSFVFFPLVNCTIINGMKDLFRSPFHVMVMIYHLLQRMKKNSSMEPKKGEKTGLESRS